MTPLQIELGPVTYKRLVNALFTFGIKHEVVPRVWREDQDEEYRDDLLAAAAMVDATGELSPAWRACLESLR